MQGPDASATHSLPEAGDGLVSLTRSTVRTELTAYVLDEREPVQIAWGAWLEHAMKCHPCLNAKPTDGCEKGMALYKAYRRARSSLVQGERVHA